MKNLVFIKTHKLNNGVVDEYLKAKNSSYDAIVVLDNKDKKLSEHKENFVTINYNGVPLPTLLLDFEMYMEYKLPGYYLNNPFLFDYNTFMWYNSDYPLYLVRKFFPDYDYYWQIEYDVFCNGDTYAPFFNTYDNRYEDLLICRLGFASKDWWAVEKTEWIWGENIPRGCCILPISRVSARCVDYLYEKRLQHGEIYKNLEQDPNASWAFCEVFVATETLNNKEFKTAPIVGQYITDQPIMKLFKDRVFLYKNNLLYHPVK